MIKDLIKEYNDNLEKMNKINNDHPHSKNYYGQLYSRNETIKSQIGELIINNYEQIKYFLITI